MLDIHLIQEKPALKVEFLPSLAADIFSTLSLVLDAPSLEGLDQWIYATHAALPPTLKPDLEVTLVLLTKSCLYPAWLSRLPAEHPAHSDFAALLAWLNALTEADFQQVVTRALAEMDEVCEGGEASLPPDLADDDALRLCLGGKFADEQLERAAHLVCAPLELKALFISVLTRFWEQFYQAEYELCAPLAARSVEHHRRQTYAADLMTVFTAVTGRRFPKDYTEHEDKERVVFLPSCHIGPFVMLSMCEEMANVLFIHYNCRPTGVPDRAPVVTAYSITAPEPASETPSVQGLFPPLKALADETRLQILALLDGKELYAQEIVEQLDISQSAVSRHLHLMLAGDILDVRKQDGMKYFSINTETLAALAAHLLQFRH